MKNQRLFLFFAGLFAVASCGDDGTFEGERRAPGPGSDAADVAYDNEGSGLAEDNVQGAIDELAARAEPNADVFDRVVLIAGQVDDKVFESGELLELRVECKFTPEGEDSPVEGVVLGGTCGYFGSQNPDENDLQPMNEAMFVGGLYCGISRRLNDKKFTPALAGRIQASVSCLFPPGTKLPDDKFIEQPAIVKE